MPPKAKTKQVETAHQPAEQVRSSERARWILTASTVGVSGCLWQLRSVPHGLLLAVAHARRFPVVPKVCCHTVGRVTFCEQLKTEGNELFAKKQWGAAADKYRAAIAVAFPPPKKVDIFGDGSDDEEEAARPTPPGSHIYYGNLSACLLELQQWAEAEVVARSALDVASKLHEVHTS